jgi:hypothetical protein
MAFILGMLQIDENKRRQELTLQDANEATLGVVDQTIRAVYQAGLDSAVFDGPAVARRRLHDRLRQIGSRLTRTVSRNEALYDPQLSKALEGLETVLVDGVGQIDDPADDTLTEDYLITLQNKLERARDLTCQTTSSYVCGDKLLAFKDCAPTETRNPLDKSLLQ